MYRRDRDTGGHTNFGDWAKDNLDDFGSEGRYINGGDGNMYGFNENGELGRWAWFEYKYFYEDGVEAEWMTHKNYEWVPLDAQQRGVEDEFYFIHNESDAYRFMLAIQNLPNGKGKEIVGVLSINQKTGKKGVLILPWGGNKYDKANPSIGYYGSFYEDYNGNRYTPLAMVHTHPENDIGPSTWEADFDSASNTYQIPSYILGDRNYVKYYPSTSTYRGDTYDLIKTNNPTSLFPK